MGKLRILFVDDERGLREIMRSELTRMGHEVTDFADGRLALKALCLLYTSDAADE